MRLAVRDTDHFLSVDLPLVRRQCQLWPHPIRNAVGPLPARSRYGQFAFNLIAKVALETGHV